MVQKSKKIGQKRSEISYKWLGPYLVENISKKDGVELSKNYNVALLKPYLDPVNPADDENKSVPLDEKPPNLENADLHEPDLQNLEGVLQRDTNSSVHRYVDAQTDINSNPCSKLPDEIVEKILALSINFQ